MAALSDEADRTGIGGQFTYQAGGVLDRVGSSKPPDPRLGGTRYCASDAANRGIHPVRCYMDVLQSLVPDREVTPQRTDSDSARRLTGADCLGRKTWCQAPSFPFPSASGVRSVARKACASAW
jgi:hypothetical protein